MLGNYLLRAALVEARNGKLNRLPRLRPNTHVLRTTGFDSTSVVLDAVLALLFITRVYPLVLKKLSRLSTAFALVAIFIFGFAFVRFENTIEVNPQTAAPQNFREINERFGVVATTAFQRPTNGKITTRYGWGHRGIDLTDPMGTPIYPTSDGKVIEVRYDRSGYGLMILVSHKDGFVSRYAHLSKINVKVGNVVTSKTVIGNVGNTGRSTGPHLHFEILHDGIEVDPARYIKI